MTELNISPIVEFIYTPVANYAIQQNRIPIVRKLIVENTSDVDFFDLKVTLKGEPDFINSWDYRIETLPKKQRVEIGVKNLKLSASFLSELTEKLSGDLILSIYSKEDVIFTEHYNVDVLAYDQWSGIRTLPEILASFVTPNHPEISKVIQTASKILDKWTGNPSFDAYQSLNPDRVKKQMGAIFEAIASLGIVYSSPPASFEDEGQRIRMCETIFSQKLATCVDIAILYASCIEAIGLNPLLIVLNGHAFVGAWLIDDTFADSVNDDVSLLKKRIASGINEILLVEATCMNAGHIQSFDEAINSANYKLVKEEEFLLFIDVKRSRLSGIKPLPQRVNTSEGWRIIEDEKIITRESVQPDKIINSANLDISEETQFTKQKLWERKLLDLSLRNNLLNLRITKSTIQLLSVNLSDFEDALAHGDEFQILTKPDEWVNPNKTSGVFQAINMSDPVVDLLKFDLSHKRLRTYLTDSELQSALKNLYRSSRLSLEENGANTLYLALGFLKWYETPNSELARYAPLLLLPVEIIRKSAQKGYIIRSREEDTIMNITLLEMLKQDFDIVINGLADLPRDESGVDVIKIFNIVRRGIMSQSRWNVEGHAFLGIFSFNKFIMWNDIHNNADKLIENKIVKSLISGKLEWECKDMSTDIDLDTKYNPTEIALPLSADSTQLEAIFAATDDNSFILHGPPGTGKSQTITNIIANALYRGQKVLFVAEKMAALTVVQKRLADIGLDPFCLELHSNKSKKSGVLEQLRKTTEVIRKTTPLEFETEANRLHKQRLELNEYVEALHKKHDFGFSLYDAFTFYAELNSSSDNIPIDEKLITELSRERFIELSDKVEELQNVGTLCGHPFNNPLNLIKTKTYNFKNRDLSGDLIKRYIELLNEKNENKNLLSELLLIDTHNLCKDKTNSLEKLCYQITTLPDVPATLINIEYPERNLSHIIESTKHGKKRDEYRDSLLSVFTKNIFKLDADPLIFQWNEVSSKWFLPKLLGQNKILKVLRPLSITGKINKDKVVEYFDVLKLYQKEQEYLSNNSVFLSKNLDFLWNNGNSEWSAVAQICDTNLQINSLIISLTEDANKVNEVKGNLANHLSNGTRSFLNLRGKLITTFITLSEEQKKIENSLFDLLKIDFKKEPKTSIDWITYWRENAEDWLVNLDSLRNWTSWNRIKEETIDKGLSAVVETYSKGELDNKEVLTSFKKSLFKNISEYIISEDNRLSLFNGKLFEGKIKKFKEQSNYFEDLTKAELFAKLAAQIPSFTQEAANSSEIGVLQRAIRNNGRAMSIRRLFDLIPNLLPRLCPCMLMSPISVAQYFEVDKTKFDLVVFDEASQLPTCEAVGPIARGQNVIVVGDPKQMPPTSFFSTNHFDEENADKEDLESILDDCLALSMPSKHLLWHYRSKHESLIAFSNSNYYENKLLTFPSPDDIATKVSNVFVPGYYDRGKTRQNSFEAEAIVSEVMERLSDPLLSKKSIGIVTFSSVQQNLIDDLLNEEFKMKPELEMLALESSEPIFIKNLENVQGDERDIILFSVGYGPDKLGKVYLNFGPLNREGGWRRLNVAITRARYEMKVFSTLRSEEIDISRTSSEGVSSIKAFLEYSEKGKMALPLKENMNKTTPSYFERMVAEEIEKMGYSVQTNIGSSGYKIDIGVVNPKKPSEYILGIMTDGKTYHAAKTAKDREIVQTDVLKMLGWNIYRLWSPDWWDNPQKVLQEIVSVIKNIQETPMKIVVAEKHAAPLVLRGQEPANVKLQAITQEVIQPVEISVKYNTCVLEQSYLYSSDEFFNSPNQQKIISQINEVLEIEAPISHSLLSRRILNAWGISRLGVRLNEYLDSIYSKMEIQHTSQNETKFYWNKNQEPKEYNFYRVPGDDDARRDAYDLAKEEVSCGVIEVLTNQISLPEEDLIRETAKVFGYARLGGNVQQAMKTGIEFALDKGLVSIKDDRFIIL